MIRAFAIDALLRDKLPWIAGLYFILFVAVYGRVITAVYGFLDDFTVLDQAIRDDLGAQVLTLVAYGRPVYALLEATCFPLLRDLGDLRIMRLASVISIGAFSVASFVYLRRINTLPPFLCIYLPVLFVLTPAFQVYAAWAVAASFPAAALLAGSAFVMLHRPTALRFLSATCLLVAALAIYQPAAMSFWIFASVAWIGSERPLRRRDILVPSLAVASALAIDFGLAKLLPIIIAGRSLPQSRTALSSDTAGKLLWFFRNPMVDALNFWTIEPSTGFAICTALFIASGLLLLHWRRPMRLFLSAALLFAAYLPNLLVAEDWSSYRTQPALAGVIIVFVSLATVAWLRRLRGERILPAAFAIWVIVSATAASYDVNRWFVKPQIAEYQRVVHHLDALRDRGDGPLALSAAQHRSFTGFYRYDEFGTLSCFAPWVPVAMARLILRKHPAPSIRLLPRGTQPLPGETLVDLDSVIFPARGT